MKSYKLLAVFLMFLMFASTMPTVNAITSYPTHIKVYGNDLDKDVFTVHTTDTSKKHNLKAQIKYTTPAGKRYILVPEGLLGIKVCFECWEKPGQDNNGNGIPGEKLYTESDKMIFTDLAEVNPAKWHKHGVPTGEYGIKINFNGFTGGQFLKSYYYKSSNRTITLKLLP